MAKSFSLDPSIRQEEIRITLEERFQGQRLDHVLNILFPWQSRTQLSKRLQQGLILINDQRCKASYRVKTHDRLWLHINPVDASQPQDVPLEIILEDEAFIVLNKGPGQVVHPVGPHLYSTLLNGISWRYRDDPNKQPYVLHRLDVMTSGALVFALGEKNAPVMQQSFEKRQTEKIYCAVVDGQLEQRLEITDPIGPDQKAAVKLKQTVCPQGKEAHTIAEPLQSNKDFSLIRVKILTGRTHQIRCHLAHHGFPLVGDLLYNPQDENLEQWTGQSQKTNRPPLIKRHALHAHELSFPHPKTQKMVRVCADLASDMKALCDTCGLNWPLQTSPQ